MFAPIVTTTAGSIMKRPARSLVLLGALAVVSSGVAVMTATPVAADETPQTLPFAQDWSDGSLITADDVWTGVPGIVGYRGDGLASTGADPQTVLGPGAPPVVDVNADEPNPSTLATGGVAEFAIADPVVALQGSGTADAPNLVVTLATTGFVDVTVAYDVRDIDGGADNATQQVALQYRVGTSGNFTNVPAGYIADATEPNAATLVTPVSAVLPAAVNDQAVVQVRIITADAPGSDEWVGIDDITITGTPGGGPAAPIATCPAEVFAAAGTTTSAVVSATDADSTIESIAITSTPVPGISLEPGAPGSATLSVGPATEIGTYAVVVTFTTDDGQEVSCEVAVTVLAITPISAVQGSGATSPEAGELVLVEAVVTSPFTTTDATSGFFAQEEAADVDADPATSEGVFVFCSTNCPPDVAKGDVVRAAGVVEERFGTTQISATAAGATSIVGTADVPAPVVLTEPSGAATEPTYESIEGMIATFTGTLTVREHFELARFGQIELIAGPRPYTFTHVAEPDVDGNAAYTAALASRTIVLDDDTDDQNDDIDGPDSNEPYAYPTAAWAGPAADGLSVDHRFRAGDTTTGLTGVMQWAFGSWRMRPVPDQAYEFAPSNPAPATPADVGGRLRVASFNVLNYFHQVDTTASENSGPCGPTGTQDCRGADSEEERLLQLAKITDALVELDADVVGLIEIENDAGQATQDIVDALNATGEVGTYAAVQTGFIGTDAIKVAFIYRIDTVATVGAPAVLTSAIDARFNDLRNRPALIQTFEEIATGERFTATINHLKSKGSSCANDTPPDPDRGDGAGNCNLSRTNAARALADYLATDPTGSGDPDVIILGDLNSYRNEDPIDVLRGAGYTDLVKKFGGDAAYSYLFDGTLGYLDHALGNASLTPQVTGVTEWHTNADEPELLDYNDDVRDIGEADFFERKSAALPLDRPDARRASDHDPVLVGLQLASLTIDDAVLVQPPSGRGNLVVSGTTGTGTDTCPTLSLRVGTTDLAIGPTTPLGRTSRCATLTSRGLFTFDRATGEFAGVLELPATIRVTEDTVRFVLTVDDTTYAVDREGRRVGPAWIAT
jgi:predicted extracellular nuclease